MNKFKATVELRNILIGSDSVNKYIEGRIFPIVAPMDTEGDFITYQRDEYSRERTKMGICTECCKVYINVMSDDYDRASDIGFLISEELEGVYSDPEMEIYLLDSTEDYDGGKYIQTLLFEIK